MPGGRPRDGHDQKKVVLVVVADADPHPIQEEIHSQQTGHVGEGESTLAGVPRIEEISGESVSS